nr:putative ORF1 [Marmot picobirnavirus]
MTGNQIEYQKLLEQRRANRASETETSKHNRATEGLGTSTLSETSRHNRAMEGRDLASYQESVRHNKASEAFNLANLSETSRHNQAQETFNVSNLAETAQHNRAQESQARNQLSLDYSKLSEAIRSNAANEDIRNAANQITKDYNDRIAQSKFIETTSRKGNLESQYQLYVKQFNELVRQNDWTNALKVADTMVKLADTLLSNTNF